jgi:predicted Rossmann fold flavoprotein
MRCINQGSVALCLEKEVIGLHPCKEGWEVICRDESRYVCKKVVFATGGMTRSYPVLEALGHTMVEPVPSLFSFDLQEEWIKMLPGSSVPLAHISIKGASFSAKGPLLITHVGISGPAVLRLSSYAARWFAEGKYRAEIRVNWTGDLSCLQIKEALYEQKKRASIKKVVLAPLFSFSKNLWKAFLVQLCPTALEKTWAEVSRNEINQISEGLFQMTFTMIGKSTHKEEFVTAGGVDLDEVHPKTLESRKAEGLYFTGEVLNIDGVTGGFNFQSAWTTAWCAAQAIHQSLLENG